MDDLHHRERRVNVMSRFLCVLFLSLSAAQEQNTITATPGQNITLTCRAPNSKHLSGVEWRRQDLKSEYVLLYRDEQFDPEEQHPSYKNRVDLQDRQMKDGDVSLILKDVKAADNGTYMCRALTPGRKRGKRASETVKIITLSVVAPPGPSGGLTEDGGKEEGGKEGGSAGLAAVGAVSVLVLVAAAVAGFVFYKKRARNQSVDSSHPIELQPLESV